jgi:uncharacterized protein
VTYKIFFILIVVISIIISPAKAGDIIQPKSGILHTKDNISISYDHYSHGASSVIIVCPGFFNSKENRWMRKAVGMFLPEYDVIIFDFRGHGNSGGRYTWSAKESLDVDIAVDYAVAQKYKHIGILAFSLGAAAAINDAATRSEIESMVLISCPARFKEINFHFWEPGMLSDLKDNIDCKWEGKGARFGSIFMKKEAPIDAIGKIKNTAVFFIQGDSDWIIKSSHAQKLYDAAKTEKKIEIIRGGLHAERLVQFNSEKIRELVLDWFSKTLK